MEEKSEENRSFPLKEQITIIKRMFIYAKPFRKTYCIAIILSLGVSLVNILLPKIIQVYMDDYLTTKSATMRIILFFAALYLVSSLIKSIFWFFQWYLYSCSSMYSFQLARSTVYKKIHTLGMEFFDKTPAGSIVSRISNDTETLFDFWKVFLLTLTVVFSTISSLIAMALINQTIAWICLFFLPVLIVIIWCYQKYSSLIYHQMRELLSQLNTMINESISGIAIIQQFRQQKRFVKNFEEINENYLATRFKTIQMNSLLLGPVINLLYAFCVVVILSLFGVQALDHLVEAGLIYAFLTYIQAFFNPMTQMMDFLSMFSDGLVAGSRIIKILDEERVAPQQNEFAEGEITFGKLEFRNVSFSYDEGNPILKNIRFSAQAGETIALVGHTGSGKSSIINILMRFYEFYEGEILIDNQNIRDIPLKKLREKMGLVPQESFMFYGDIADNIRLLNDKITDEEIEEAAKFVQADKFIEKLPEKYHEKVIERGTSYSSGERQLISFARTMAIKPKILVLDEATANIDTETEMLIQESLAKMRKGRTTIAVAHRLSTIRDADVILVLDKGEIVERGNHDALIKQKGLYYDMYQLQKGSRQL